MGLTGWETMQGADGEIFQAGIPSTPAEDHDDGQQTWGWITRALVTALYYADEDERNGWVKGKQRAVLADVRTIGRYSRLLFKVPVLQRTQGLWDEDIYIPRAAKINISEGTFASGSAGVDGAENAPTPAEQTDGDQVLLGFLDNDPRQPVILPFTLGHPASNAAPHTSQGRFRRIRHNGVVVEWDKDGNFTVDATEAAKPDFFPNGWEQSNSGIAGKILLTTKDAAGAVSSFKLDNLGGSKLLGAGGEYFETVKGTRVRMDAGGNRVTVESSGKVSAEAATDIELTAFSAMTCQAATTMTLKALDLKGSFGAHVAVDAGAVMALTAPEVNLGVSSGTFPLLKVPPAWLGTMTTLLLELTTQIATYSGGPPVVVVSDYYNLLLKLQAVLALEAPCAIVKGF